MTFVYNEGHMCISLGDAQGCILSNKVVLFYWNLLTICQAFLQAWGWGEEKRERMCKLLCAYFSGVF